MEGKETSPSQSSEESSVLVLPSVCDLAECFLPPHSSENSEELFQSMDTIPPPATEETNLPSADAESCSAAGLEEANSCSPKAGLGEPPEPSSAALSWICEDDSAEDPSIRRSLDGFYSRYCQPRPERVDPTCEAAAQCLAQKIAELANQEGSKYACRCLQMAQVVLNREGCKLFPNHPSTVCFAKAPEEVMLGDRKATPGLSDDVLQFLLKQTLTQHSPEK